MVFALLALCVGAAPLGAAGEFELTPWYASDVVGQIQVAAGVIVAF